MVTASPVALARKPASTFNRQLRVFVGLMHLACTVASGALDDAQGRCAYGDPAKRRKQSADARRWLRSAGKYDPQKEYFFSIDWCAELLSLDVNKLAREGLPRMQGGGLANWRSWRQRRPGNRINARPVRTVECPECGQVFETRLPKQTYCGAVWSRQHINSARRYQPQIGPQLEAMCTL